MSSLADQRVRDRIRSDLDTTLIVEAAAGTGKTTALVNRIVAAIEAGRAPLNRMVAVTFTEKAAGELKLRLRSEIEKARSDAALDRQRDYLTDALRQLEEARIGTIHAFCAELLRERPIEARVDPLFEMAPEETAGELLEAAFDRWFQEMLAAPGEGMRRLLRRRASEDGDGPREVARRAAGELLKWRDFDASWRHTVFDREGEIDTLIEEARALGALTQGVDPDDWLRKSIDEIWQTLADALRLEAVAGRDYDALEAILTVLPRGRRWGWRGWGDEFGAIPRAQAIARRDAFREHLLRFQAEAGASLAPLLRDELWPVTGHYEALKRNAGLLDFLDLLLVTRNLVRDNAEVRAELQQRFDFIFVDEFQDTDPLQAEILLLLAADDPLETEWTRVRPVPGKLFIVGDPKQSIYRFRRADVALYQNVKRTLVERGAALEYLTVSFRATPGLQSMINAVFAPEMEADTDGQPKYAPLMPFRPACESQPPVVVLPVPAPYNERGFVTKRAIDDSLPDAIAAYIKWLVDHSGWTVTTRDEPEHRVALKPAHICILFRRFTAYGRDVTRTYMRALEARHIQHVVVRGTSFNEREEVEAIRNALGAIERPDDELLVFATLRGPFFALGDDALLEFRTRAGGAAHPFRRFPDDLPEHLQEVTEALTLLRELHRGRNRRPIADTIGQFLARTRAHAGIAIWPTGEQALANLMRVMDMARRYEGRSGATSFRGFVDHLELRAERDEASEVPVVEEGTEGVRIMSVHRAKGLEFPVVILADITCNETAGEAHRFVDPMQRLCALRLAGCAPAELAEHAEEELNRDRDEAVRLLYVGATRARDVLVVPAVGDEPQDGWLARLNPGIYPEPANRRTPLSSQPPGCPEFGDDSVVIRPPAPKTPSRAKSVAPGLHRAQRGEHQVVWWDCRTLVLNVQEAMGLRQSKLLEADESGIAAAEGDQRYQIWRARRATMLENAARPAFVVATATELAAQAIPNLPPAEIELVELPRSIERPGGKRFGTLVHATMLRVESDARAGAIREAAELQGRMLGATPVEIAAAAVAVGNALAAPLIIRAFAARECRRECAIVARLTDGTLVEGVADLAFLDEHGSPPCWTVIDFKTDADWSRRLAEYRVQLGLYMAAISASTGLSARGVLLGV
ncbi:MAG TPA: UvrD-helicase domain-containing protein [Candidatus Binataceae bacterium]|nr:UvrD-helicase domain-containing protein [Candidatus Binataceae bacterium]